MQKDLGNGAGFVAAAGEHVDFTLTDSNGAVHSAPTGTLHGRRCEHECVGSVHDHVHVELGGQGDGACVLDALGRRPAAFTVQTDGRRRTPVMRSRRSWTRTSRSRRTATNRVGRPHVHGAVEKNLGLGGGWVAAAGETATMTSDEQQRRGGESVDAVVGHDLTRAGISSVTFTVGDARSGDGARFELVESRLGAGSDRGADERSGPERLGRGEDVRGRADPHHAGRRRTVLVQPHLHGVGGEEPRPGRSVAAAGETVTMTLTNSNGAAANPSTPAVGHDRRGRPFLGHLHLGDAGSGDGARFELAESRLAQDPIVVQTNGQGLNGSDAVKTFVDARIHITPSATNRVGENHTFTALVEKNLGPGWVAAAGETVTITLTDSSGAAANPSTPLSGTTDAGGHFSATFTSATPGQVTGHASSSLTLGWAHDPIVVQTNGQGLNGSDAVKTFVDARIHITPSATNEVGQPHTFTALVEKNLGLGGGWVCRG